MCCIKEKNDVNKYVLLQEKKKETVLPLVSFYLFFFHLFLFKTGFPKLPWCHTKERNKTINTPFSLGFGKGL